MKTALNSYTNILQQIPLNVRSLDKQDSVEIKEWSTKKLLVTSKQVQHKGIESSFHIVKTVLPQITQNEIFEAIQNKIVQNNEHKMAIFHFKTIHQIIICGKILSKWESNVSQICNLCNKEDDISHIDGHESKPANSNFSIFLFDKFKGNTLLHNVLKNLVPSMSLYPSFRQLSKTAISHRDTFQQNKTGYKPSFCCDNDKRH